MTSSEMWELFCKGSGVLKDTPYEAWQFGSDLNGLADLVLKGEKTGTASAYDMYLLDGVDVPKSDCYSLTLPITEVRGFLFQCSTTF